MCQLHRYDAADSTRQHVKRHQRSPSSLIHYQRRQNVAGYLNETHYELYHVRIPFQFPGTQRQSVVHEGVGEPAQADVERPLQHVRRPEQIQHAGFLPLGAPKFADGLVFVRVDFDGAVVHPERFLDYPNRFLLAALGPQPPRGLVHDPPVAYQDEAVESVDDLQNLAVFNERSPERHQYEPRGEGALESYAARGSLAGADDLHGEHEARDVAPRRTEDAVQEPDDQKRLERGDERHQDTQDQLQRRRPAVNRLPAVLVGGVTQRYGPGKDAEHVRRLCHRSHPPSVAHEIPLHSSR